MSAMSAEDLIFILKMSANTGSDRFLPHIRVTGAMDQTALMRFGQPFLTKPYQQHPPVKFHNYFGLLAQLGWLVNCYYWHREELAIRGSNCHRELSLGKTALQEQWLRITFRSAQGRLQA